MTYTTSLGDELTLAFFRKYPIEGARLLESLSPEATATLLEPLPLHFMARTFQHLHPHSRLAIFKFMDEEGVLEILTNMTPSSTFTTLHLADRTLRAGLLAKMNLRQNASVLKAFSYPEGSAGRFADPHVLTLTGDRTISDAIQWIQTHQDESTDEIYVVDQHHMFQGCISIQKLLIADIDDLLKDVAPPSQQILSASWSMEGISKSPAWLTNHTLPVIDTNKLFLGVIRYSTLLSTQQSKQMVHPEATTPACESALSSSVQANGKILPHFMRSRTLPNNIAQKPDDPKVKPLA